MFAELHLLLHLTPLPFFCLSSVIFLGALLQFAVAFLSLADCPPVANFLDLSRFLSFLKQSSSFFFFPIMTHFPVIPLSAVMLLVAYGKLSANQSCRNHISLARSGQWFPVQKLCKVDQNTQKIFQILRSVLFQCIIKTNAVTATDCRSHTSHSTMKSFSDVMYGAPFFCPEP